MPSKKKVVLFLVEGPSDETAIRGPVNLLIQNSFNSDSASFHGDVTTAQIEYPTFYRIKDNIRDTVKTFVEDYLRDTNPGYKAKDIHCIVHIMDTDGAFIDDSMVVLAEDGQALTYREDRIEAPNPRSIQKRNARKESAMLQLSRINELTINRVRVRYLPFFMSRNLEHVLYGLQGDLDDKTKGNLAHLFYLKCQKNPRYFLDCLREATCWAAGTHEESWSALGEGANSLHRGTNFGLLFSESDERYFLGEF